MELVNFVLAKISSYQLFNFIVPGASLLTILKFLYNMEIGVDENLGYFMLASYVVGLTLSRIGSVWIEGIMVSLKWIDGYDVSKYIEARKENMIVETMLSLANLYRTMGSLFVCDIVVLLVTGRVEGYCLHYLVYAVLTCLFIASFIKQYSYFKKSI